jgi:YrhK-like protein
MHRPAWRVGVLFAIGSTCFFLGPFPGFIQLVGSAADGTVFFVGSVFFTLAALLQLLQLTSGPGRTDWWSSLIQLVGTVFFNVDTFRAMQDSFDTSNVDRLVWAPELIGSICFLVSGLIAYLEVRDGGLRSAERTRDWKIATVNFAGCILFGISAIAGYVVPKTGDVLDLAAANVTTSLGALCFLVGAVLLISSEAGEPAAAART